MYHVPSTNRHHISPYMETFKDGFTTFQPYDCSSLMFMIIYHVSCTVNKPLLPRHYPSRHHPSRHHPPPHHHIGIHIWALIVRSTDVNVLSWQHVPSTNHLRHVTTSTTYSTSSFRLAVVPADRSVSASSCFGNTVVTAFTSLFRGVLGKSATMCHL